MSHDSVILHYQSQITVINEVINALFSQNKPKYTLFF